jgi:hypothetical protein
MLVIQYHHLGAKYKLLSEAYCKSLYSRRCHKEAVCRFKKALEKHFVAPLHLQKNNQTVHQEDSGKSSKMLNLFARRKINNYL